MRATIEIPDHLRTAIMTVAARKGYRGYSKVVVEALEFYLSEKEGRQSGLRQILELKGSWGRQEGHDVRRRVKDVRRGWR